MSPEQIFKLDEILATLRATCIADDSLPVLTINQYSDDPGELSAFTASDCTKETALRLLKIAISKIEQ